MSRKAGSINRKPYELLYANYLALSGRALGQPGAPLYHMPARTYDSRLKAFLQPDSVDRFRYAYAAGDPLNASDPTGLLGMAPAVQILTFFPSGLLAAMAEFDEKVEADKREAARQEAEKAAKSNQAQTRSESEKQEETGSGPQNENGVVDTVTAAAGSFTANLAAYSVNDKNPLTLRLGATVLGTVTSLADQDTIGKTALTLGIGALAFAALPLALGAAAEGTGLAGVAQQVAARSAVAATDAALATAAGAGGVAAVRAGQAGEATAGVARVLGTRLTGYTEHGIHSAISHDGVGVAPRAILEALRNPISVISQANDTVRYVGANAIVVLNRSGQLVTTWALNSGSTRTP